MEAGEEAGPARNVTKQTGGTRQARRWCFTDNNPTTRVEIEWHGWPDIRGGVCQLELGESGTLHYQGYAEFTQPKRLAACKKLLPRAHWTAADGTPEQNEKYCTKEEGRQEGPWKFGVLGGTPGKRSDLAEAKRVIDQGGTEEELAEAAFGPFIRNYEGLMRYKRLRITPREHLTELHVICGPPGSGKSTLARDMAPGAMWFRGGKWWDGYSGQRVVIMDEFRGSFLPFQELLRLADRFPYSTEVKGGMREFTSKAIIITSNYMPEAWYTGEHITPQALFRRITSFMWLDHTEEGTYIVNKYPPQI